MYLLLPETELLLSSIPTLFWTLCVSVWMMASGRGFSCRGWGWGVFHNGVCGCEWGGEGFLGDTAVLCCCSVIRRCSASWSNNFTVKVKITANIQPQKNNLLKYSLHPGSIDDNFACFVYVQMVMVLHYLSKVFVFETHFCEVCKACLSVWKTYSIM